jgi:hypothetical protein
MTAIWSGITNPTTTDWIGLYASGAAETAFIDWIYVSCSQIPGSAQASGSCPFTVPATVAPGAYQLRLLALNGFTRLATSNAFTVTGGGGVTLSVSPTSVAAGGTVTATWVGIPNPTATDWLGLYVSGTIDTAFRAWRYTSGTASGYVSFTIPATVAAGTYELRLFSNDGFTRLAPSNAFTVTSPPRAFVPGRVATDAQ